MRMFPTLIMKRLLTPALLLCSLAFLGQEVEAQPAARLSPGASGDSTLYRLVSSVFDEARLTARLELGSYWWNHAIPLLEGTSHEGRALDSRLEPATIYLAGLVAGAEYRAARIFGWFRFNMGNKNVGLLPSERTRVRFRNGDAAAGALASPEFKAYGVRSEYVPVVWDDLALGGGLSYRYRSEYLPPACDPECDAGIRVESGTNLFSLYVPARYRFGWGTLHARAGMSLWGDHKTLYRLGIASDDQTPGPNEPPPNPGNLKKSRWKFTDADPHLWTAEAGLAVPVRGFMIHADLHVERIWLEGAYTETVGGLKLQVGLPF